MKNQILDLEHLPVAWEDSRFPEELMKLIKNRAPNYLSCEAKICKIEDDCVLDKEIKGDVYAQPGIITANLEIYNPRQLKLFCWIGEPEEAVPEKPRAIVSLVFSDTEYSLVGGVNHTYTSTRTFTESGGVGVNLTEGQVCYSIGEPHCDPKGNVNYRIEANGILTQEGKKLWTDKSERRFTLKYWGVDDNEYDVYIEQHMCVQETNFEENCGVE